MPDIGAEKNRQTVRITIDGSGGTSEPSDYTTDTQKTKNGYGNSDKTIPAGAYYLDIQITNASFGGQIMINGQPLNYGGQYHREAKENPVTKKLDLVGEAVIQSNGVQYQFSVSYPSDTTVDLSTF